MSHSCIIDGGAQAAAHRRRRRTRCRRSGPQIRRPERGVRHGRDREHPIELVEEVYGRLAERVAVGRERLGRPLTLTEKVLVNHLRDPQDGRPRAGQSYTDFDPDRIAMQDATAQMALLQFMTAGPARGGGARPRSTATT